MTVSRERVDALSCRRWKVTVGLQPSGFIALGVKTRMLSEVVLVEEMKPRSARLAARDRSTIRRWEIVTYARALAPVVMRSGVKFEGTRRL